MKKHSMYGEGICLAWKGLRPQMMREKNVLFLQDVVNDENRSGGMKREYFIAYHDNCLYSEAALPNAVDGPEQP